MFLPLTRVCRQWVPRLSSVRRSSSMTTVERTIHEHIKLTGPIPFATYMKLCLSHPTHGYYMTSKNKVFGTGGDFITSPEISQTFGELVAIWFLSQSRAQKLPVRFVELGPGRGTLMDDILRVYNQLTPSTQDVNVHLVETSPSMRALQKDKLATRTNVKLHWHESLSEIPPTSREYTVLVAHEFFDALPIHVLQKKEDGWHEVLVASAEEETKPTSETTGARVSGASDAPPPADVQPPTSLGLRRVLQSKTSAPATLLGLSSERFRSLPEGSMLEVSPTSFRIGRRVGELLERGRALEQEDGRTSAGGAGLIIDYGGDKAFGDSFRAFKSHKIVDVFDQPGECDLTANVDFAYLKESMNDIVKTHGPISQASFLELMGLPVRVSRLVQQATSEEQKTQIIDGAKRLADRTGMGKEYQILGITSKDTGPGETAKEAQVYPFLDGADNLAPDGEGQKV